MAANTKIEWATHTFNPWIGCTKVSPGCDNCWAEALDERRQKLWGGTHWGAGVPRRLTSPGMWQYPGQWNKAQRKHELWCIENGHKPSDRPRVFCASLADVFDPEVPVEWRVKLWETIAATQHLNWLVLTKRPQFFELVPDFRRNDDADLFENLWLGVTVENQDLADKRIPKLTAQNLPWVRFLSVEPMLSPVSLRGFDTGRIGWVICGGESGPGARPFDIAWARALRDECAEFGIPFFMKQLGSNPAGLERGYPYSPKRSSKGGDPTYWPADLNVRQYPKEAGMFP
jgi:protein gp37